MCQCEKKSWKDRGCGVKNKTKVFLRNHRDSCGCGVGFSENRGGKKGEMCILREAREKEERGCYGDYMRELMF